MPGKAPTPASIADLKIWAPSPDRTVTAELTPDEAELINLLRQIDSDQTFSIVAAMVRGAAILTQTESES